LRDERKRKGKEGERAETSIRAPLEGGGEGRLVREKKRANRNFATRFEMGGRKGEGKEKPRADHTRSFPSNDRVFTGKKRVWGWWACFRFGRAEKKKGKGG